jgi:hypothetical protein
MRSELPVSDRHPAAAPTSLQLSKHPTHQPTAARFRLCLFVAVTLLLAACGGDDDESNPAPGGGANRSPTISGTPPTAVLYGTPYEFAPTASDPDGDPLTFSISGKPSWASFDTNTGRLYGTPGQSDIGTYSNVRISVSDGQNTSTLGPFDVGVVASASGVATVSWTAPTERSDGSPLADLAGFKVYWGTSPGHYPNSATINNPSVSTHVVEQLTPATWYFVATAIDSSGMESHHSNVGSKTIH